MSASLKLALLAVLLVAAWTHEVRADKKTVCTITVNSSDEKEIFRRSLPEDDFQFVELVERGRPDWLASACRKDVHCDVLLISGHFDDGTEFYSDRLDARESLPVDQMERASCSDSCPGLFSQLKEVYLFGCNTLQAQPLRSASAEIARSLIRSGHSPADAERLSRQLNERHGESNRDRMRQIFKDVPVIYGFSSKAPLGRTAGPMLDRYFQSGASGEIGSGRASPRLLSLFAPSSMTAATGSSDSDSHAGFRQDVCHFSDDRLSAAQKLGFVHQLLNREMAEVRMFLDHIEKYAASLSETERQAPAVARALGEIARDEAARTRYLDFVRDADQPAIRARMIGLAANLGWLSPAEKRAELMRMIGDQLARNAVSPAEVDLACALNKNHELDQDLDRLQLPPAQADKVPHAAVLACLGRTEAHARVLRALTSPNDEEVQIAQIYLHHRPIDDATELRGVATGIARMNGSDAQARALDTLAPYHLSDRESLEALTRLFPLAKSVNVQRAIAGILIRSDFKTIATPEFVKTLRQSRLKSPDGADLIDVLIRRLQSS
ncbi:MAG: hypothetical protein E6H64_14935 [Betaproteobacteria bacterium]|nr:MAG: hypothetical protein E6H64_14935 [Betaproteobacteria bacterium]